MKTQEINVEFDEVKVLDIFKFNDLLKFIQNNDYFEPKKEYDSGELSFNNYMEIYNEENETFSIDFVASNTATVIVVDSIDLYSPPEEKVKWEGLSITELNVYYNCEKIALSNTQEKIVVNELMKKINY